MITFDFEQRSTDWYKVRKGVFTASEVGKFAISAKPNAREESARKKLIYKKLAEISGCYMAPIFESDAMRRGTELEPEAREAYTSITGNVVEEVGFALHDSKAFGCSPDGCIGLNDTRTETEGLIEIKCPESQTHVAYLFEGVLPDSYEMQVHMQLATTGAKWCDFFSYCPGLPPLLIRVEPNKLTFEIERGLIRLHKEFEDYKSQLADLWDAGCVNLSEKGAA